MRTLRAGELRDAIHIQRKTGGKSGYGAPMPEAWESITAKAIWANVKHLSGSESIKADADVSVVKASVRIRWRVGITAGMRILHAGTVYDIEAVLPGATRQHIDLACKKVG
ncbi:phage head closure protein [Comamonas sp.]|uniref:phage head closure protein n=1 Tax=Comamonas sp. TaxID=34028 RepID=UPI002585795A|nr:phage head closure protein [Comamonas sp.]